MPLVRTRPRPTGLGGLRSWQLPRDTRLMGLLMKRTEMWRSYTQRHCRCFASTCFCRGQIHVYGHVAFQLLYITPIWYHFLAINLCVISEHVCITNTLPECNGRVCYVALLKPGEPFVSKHLLCELLYVDQLVYKQSGYQSINQSIYFA